MKKYLALLLVLVMALGLFAACGTEKPADTTAPKTNETEGTTTTTTEAPKDPVTLVWHQRGNGVQTDNEKVMAEFNKKLQAIPGFEHITIKLVNNLGSGEQAQAVNRAYTAKEQIDIVCTVGLNMTQMSRDGYFVGLSEYFEEHTTLWETFPEWLWDTQYVDDDYYVVPNYQRGYNPKCICIRDDVAAVADVQGLIDLITWENGHSKGTFVQILSKIEEIHEAALQINPNFVLPRPWLLLTQYTQLTNWREAANDVIIDNTGLYIDFLTAEVGCLWLDPDYMTACKFAADWYAKGYLPEEENHSLDNGSMWFELNQTNTYILEDAQASAEAGYTKLREAGVDFTLYFYLDGFYFENRWAANGNAVSATCKNPEDAVAFLELLNSEDGKELYNILVYGLEGEHWEWVDEENEKIKTLDYDSTQGGPDARHALLKWCVGNTFNAYDNQGCAEGERVVAYYINDNGIKSPYAGIKLDFTDYEVLMGNMKVAYGEYASQLKSGKHLTTWLDSYNGQVQLLKNAGVDEVLAGLQKQVDDYIASRG